MRTRLSDFTFTNNHGSPEILAEFRIFFSTYVKKRDGFLFALLAMTRLFDLSLP
jgi:hypothetical protein